MIDDLYYKMTDNFHSWFKENTPKEGLSENTTFTKQFVIDAWNNGFLKGLEVKPKWNYVTDKLPPNPKETEDGKSILPLNYICAYDCGDGDYECDEFMYLGDGVWNGENKNYPIYAWMDCAVEVPLPRKENK